MYPQQKVYLHLDKPEYLGGDDLWVKAYLVNGLDHMPDTLSTNLYVELISPFKTRVEIKRFQMFDGFGIGDFKLSDTLPEGLYQIRAYTMWMQNFDTEFFFEKNFQLSNPRYIKQISPKQARVNKREIAGNEKLADDIDLQFMPEGGYLVNGLESVVAFKAINKLGKGVEIKGTIIDDKGKTVTSFTSFSKGIGTFILKPERGRKYFAVTPLGNKEMRTPLPLPLESGLVMHAVNNTDNISVHLVSNKPVTSDPSANELIITGQVGGNIYYYATVRLENGEADLEITKKVFPTGIMQLTVFSGRGDPLAERLVFVNRNDLMRISFSASDTLTEDGMKVVMDIQVRDIHNKPLTANLSMSVIREGSGLSHVSRNNIFTSLFLTSDLKGTIEDPFDYFTPPSPGNVKAIDNLMLTQGWRRFEWNKILAGNYPVIKYHEERGITVMGKITHDFFSIPLKNCRVQLSIMDAYNDVFTQYSSVKGIFLFENLVYYDTVSVKIEAWRPSGRRNLVILLPDEKINEVQGQQGDYSLITTSERDNKAYRIEANAESKQAYLEEQKRLKEERENSLTSFYGEPDYILYAKDIPINSSNILEAMKGRIPGVQVLGNSVIIRGINTINGSTEPLYLIDGTAVRDVGSVLAIPVSDIDRVEVLKGPSAAFYGVRGSNGVIAVYTKRGHYMVRGKIEFDMLGYHSPRTFYQPKYQPNEEPPDDYTLLWEPVIITNAEGKARIYFDKPLVHGNYRFDIQGISYMGHAGFLESVISNQ